MQTRIAASLALLAFTMCLIVGAWNAQNPFTTTVGRALLAMGGTFVIGRVIGAMTQKMLDEAAMQKLQKATADKAAAVSLTEKKRELVR